MSHLARADVLDKPPASVAASIGKVLILAGADRETAAHCRVLLGVLREIAHDVVVVSSLGAAGEALDAADIGVADLDCAAPWGNPLHKAAEAWRLARIIEAERPDVVHILGLRPAALAALALQLADTAAVVVHLPELGALDPGAGQSSGLAWPYRRMAPRLLAALLRRPASFLLVGCEDDLADLKALGVEPEARFAVLAGTGVDPDTCPVLPPASGEMPVAAFIGAIDEGNGVHLLMQAFERLWARGLRLQLEVHGEHESPGPPDALSGEWGRWCLHPGVRSGGWPEDTREVWRRAEICVWPAQTRQGLPHALLEAAACGRALIVTDVAGGARVFVRDDVEGVVVPVQDAAALGAALERLARDAGLRQRMGAAARLRLLQGFTEAHVRETLRGAYLSLAGAGAR